MKKIIYFMRHSEVLKGINHEFNNDDLQVTNEKSILSSNGERLAYELSKHNEFSDLDLVVSSNYVRAMSTAKYFVNENSEFAVVDLFNERRHGVNFWDELPEDFERKQFEDFNFKTMNGESLNDVLIRMLNGLDLLLNHTSAEKILVVSHATCITAMLSTWCSVKYGENIKFKDKIIKDNHWNYLDSFKLEFENDELVNIENLKF